MYVGTLALKAKTERVCLITWRDSISRQIAPVSSMVSEHDTTTYVDHADGTYQTTLLYLQCDNALQMDLKVASSSPAVGVFSCGRRSIQEWKHV
jgi:hypothetical protein